MKKNFLFVVCENKAEKMVQETLTKNKIKTQSSRSLGNVHVFYLMDAESKITETGCSLIGLKNSLPIKIEIFDQNGVI